MLKGKVALVTGASRGIGNSIAFELAKEGADIIVNYASSNKKAEELVDKIKTLGNKAIAVKADVSDYNEVAKMFESAKAEFKKIDILVNNAGIVSFGTADTLTEKDWDKVINVNLKGVFFGTKYAAKQMLKQGKGGRIINISSIAGLVGFPGISAYCASKGGVTELTREAALYLLAKKIGIAKDGQIALGEIKQWLSANTVERTRSNG